MSYLEVHVCEPSINQVLVKNNIIDFFDQLIEVRGSNGDQNTFLLYLFHSSSFFRNFPDFNFYKF